MTAILGISANQTHSAAAIVVDGEVVAAVQEERFSRRIGEDRFPNEAIRYCLSEARIDAADVDHIGFFEKPIRKLDRLVETVVAFAPAGFRSFASAIPRLLKRDLCVPASVERALGTKVRNRIVFVEHHESHASQAFFSSPYEEAAILTVDGAGEWATTAISRGCGNKIRIDREMYFPHSLGLLYTAFWEYLGMERDGTDSLISGTARRGEPRFQDAILRDVIDVKPDGSFWIDVSYFTQLGTAPQPSLRLHRLLEGPPRGVNDPIEQRHLDVAASIQSVIEGVIRKLGLQAYQLFGSRNLCLAGDVCQICSSDRILRDSPFEKLWIAPSCTDAGSALGVAMFIWHQLLDTPRVPQASGRPSQWMLGFPSDVCGYLDRVGVRYRQLEKRTLVDRVSRLLADGKAIGWFEGRLQFGPRSPEGASIPGDSRNQSLPAMIDRRIEYLDSRSPSSMCALESHAAAHLEDRANDDERRPLDARVNVLSKTRFVERSRRLRRLMEQCHDESGGPELLDTSLGLGGNPVMNRPEEAYQLFMSSSLDAIVLEDTLVLKEEQSAVQDAVCRTSSGAIADPGLARVWQCPACMGPLGAKESEALCVTCGRSFAHEDGIWRLFAAHEQADDDVTDTVKAFYEANPFPNYSEHESLNSLVAKSKRSRYASLLHEQIPQNSTVLEVGCGTGQLTNYLATGCRTVIGADMCLSSLVLAESFRSKHDLNRARFIQMNLFRPAVKPASADYVICNGVLHHTSDPAGGFRSIAALVKPGGYLLVGLYNRFGRLVTDARRRLFQVTGRRFTWLDPVLRRTRNAGEQHEAWFADQYQHPHESKHTMAEAFGWFAENGLSVTNVLPKISLNGGMDENESLFEPGGSVSRMTLALTQASMLINGYREGGYFVVIGRRAP